MGKCNRSGTNAVKEKSLLYDIGKRIVRWMDGMVNLTVFVLFLMLAAYGCYAIWDSNQIYSEADKKQYETYKPEGDNSESFAELQKLNPEVIAWLTIYGTNIDYPVAQTDDNQKYVNVNAKGEFSLAGSLFLDYRNTSDFSDFCNIIYGHHMEKKAMFGELENFTEETFFKEHRYGSLYVNGREKELEFAAILKDDAYNNVIYNPTIGQEEKKQEFLTYIKLHAMHSNDMELSESDQILLLSTCTPEGTNGRFILVAKIDNEMNAGKGEKEDGKKK